MLSRLGLVTRGHIYRSPIRRLSKLVDKCPEPRYDTGCTFCEIPQFPKDKQIDFLKHLHQTASQPWKHVLVLLHGVADFHSMPLKINLIPGSLASEFELYKRTKLSPNHPVLVSNIIVNSPKNEDLCHQGTTHKVLVYPEAKIVEFERKHLSEFIEHYLLPEEGYAATTYNPFSSSKKNVKFQSVKRPELFAEQKMAGDLVVVCGHTQRDVRCGKLAPLLTAEFTKVLHRENLDNEVDVGLISHIGGHAYAGNVIYFPRDEHTCPVTWYGRVFPQNVQGIIEETVKNKRIISELFRGDLKLLQ